MKANKYLIISILFILFVSNLYSQVDPYLINEEIELNIDKALDLFSSGEYDQAIIILKEVLTIDPTNKRASDLIESITELYLMEVNTDENQEQSYITEKPDFRINDPFDESSRENNEDELEKPDFSVRDENDQLRQPEESRTVFELSLSPNLVLPWQIGVDSVVFPEESNYSGSFSVKADYFLNFWDRIFGISGAYSIFLLNPEEGGFASDQLHVIDAMVNFRTFFSETYDSRIIFKLALGYRGYFSNGYNFYSIDKNFLNGFNMGLNLEAPLLYLFWDVDFFKRIVFDVDMNLLFFPELNTLNLFDFKINGEIRFNNFSTGIHFGAYSFITPETVEYLWMTGLSINFYF